jgi:hypothetical protein
MVTSKNEWQLPFSVLVDRTCVLNPAFNMFKMPANRSITESGKGFRPEGALIKLETYRETELV